MAATKSTGPVRANALLWANDVWLEILGWLREGRSVTEFVLEPRSDDEGPDIRFEIVVKQYGKRRLPRVTPAMLLKVGQHDR